jgi:hypothetical protein
MSAPASHNATAPLRTVPRPGIGRIRDGPVLISFAQVEVSRNPSRN